MTEVRSPFDENEKVELKDPGLAAFLAWLIPGLGHFYQQRWAKGIIFFVLILGTFAYGCYLGGDSQVGWGRVVYVTWRKDDQRWHYFCQLPVGLAAVPAIVQANRIRNNKPPIWGGFMAPPVPEDQEKPETHLTQPTLSTLNYHLHHFFELGTVYTMIAGLLNVLAIYDAWGGPFWAEPRKRKETGDEQEDGEESGSGAGSAQPGGLKS